MRTIMYHIGKRILGYHSTGGSRHVDIIERHQQPITTGSGERLVKSQREGDDPCRQTGVFLLPVLCGVFL
jgi:hypothetical protein